MAVVAAMAVEVRLELGERRALFATLADLAVGDLRNTWKNKNGHQFLSPMSSFKKKIENLKSSESMGDISAVSRHLDIYSFLTVKFKRF